MPARLHLDHENARFLADGLAQVPGIKVSPVETNIIIFDISGTGMSSAEMSKRLAEHSVLANGVDPQTMRMVTHMDVDRAACQRALEAVESVAKKAQSVSR
jgi:threonine aldolase